MRRLNMVKIPPSASLQVCPSPNKGLKLPSPLGGEGPRERGDCAVGFNIFSCRVNNDLKIPSFLRCLHPTTAKPRIRARQFPRAAAPTSHRSHSRPPAEMLSTSQSAWRGIRDARLPGQWRRPLATDPISFTVCSAMYLPMPSLMRQPAGITSG